MTDSVYAKQPTFRGVAGLRAPCPPAHASHLHSPFYFNRPSGGWHHSGRPPARGRGGGGGVTEGDGEARGRGGPQAASRSVYAWVTRGAARGPCATTQRHPTGPRNGGRPVPPPDKPLRHGCGPGYAGRAAWGRRRRVRGPRTGGRVLRRACPRAPRARGASQARARAPVGCKGLPSAVGAPVRASRRARGFSPKTGLVFRKEGPSGRTLDGPKFGSWEEDQSGTMKSSRFGL